jgi:hypothetical protein
MERRASSAPSRSRSPARRQHPSARSAASSASVAGHARLLGVVGQPRRLVPGRHHQMGEDLAVQLDAPAGGNGPLHRQAGQLVAEAETATLAAEHPGGDALVDGRRVGPGDRLQERRLDAVGHDRGGVERATGHRREPAGPGEHGVAHGRRHLPAGGAEHLGDEERVAAGGVVEAVGVDPPRAGQRGHGLPGQRRGGRGRRRPARSCRPASPPPSTRQPCPSVAWASQPSSDPRNVPRSSSTMAGS